MVHFVGAGPGACDLITVRGMRLLEEADLLIYAGSLVSQEFIGFLKPGAGVYNSAAMTLEEVCQVILSAEEKGQTTVRLHTGDPSLYGTIGEQISFLKEHSIEYDVTPGVSAAFAAAAEMGMEYTLPGISQTLILTRIEGKTPVPEAESIEALSHSHSSMAIYLSIKSAERISKALIRGGYSPETPALIAYRVSWPDQRIVRTTVGELGDCQRREKIEKTALVIVGDAISQSDFDRSLLYDPAFSTEYRG